MQEQNATPFTFKEWLGGFIKITAILITIAVVLCGAFFLITMPQFLETTKTDRALAGEKTSLFTYIFKNKPQINANPTIDPNNSFSNFLGCNFEINCKDDYKEVIILVELINRDGAVYKQDYITFEDCDEGKKYSKTYTLTAEEILKTGDLHYELYKYK